MCISPIAMQPQLLNDTPYSTYHRSNLMMSLVPSWPILQLCRLYWVLLPRKAFGTLAIFSIVFFTKLSTVAQLKVKKIGLHKLS